MANRGRARQAGAVTGREALEWSEGLLAAEGVPGARVDAEWLLAHVLGCSRTDMLAVGEKELDAVAERRLRELVERRGQRVPLQHLLGTAVFCGLEMAVDGRVLVPRPETEVLAELAGEFAGELPSPVVLDWGTGSGCLAIALVMRCPEAVVHALDISAAALAVARANAEQHGVAKRIRFHEGDGREGLPGTEVFDVIVANPPYIPTVDIKGLEPEVRDHDPKAALEGGADGLAFYRALAQVARGRLAGRMFLEVGDGQAGPVEDLLVEARWHVDKVVEDLNNLPRIVIASVSAP